MTDGRAAADGRRTSTLPTDEINYMRNSVKAVVDAYDGSVTLYEWDRDPILDAWSEAFPERGAVRARRSPTSLLAHMRYPEDMFKVQRHMLASTTSTNPQDVLRGHRPLGGPGGPGETKTNKQPPYRLSVQTPGRADEPVFSLTSVYVPQERQNLASFISVDSDAPSDDYGKIRILRLPSNTQVPGPVADRQHVRLGRRRSRTGCCRSRGRTRRRCYGNLLTLPVGDGLLYVQPLYTLREEGEGALPGAAATCWRRSARTSAIGSTLTAALNDVLGITTPEDSVDPAENPDLGGVPSTGPSAPVSGDVRELLQQAEDKFVEAEQALRDGDLNGYAEASQEARDLVQQAIEEAGQGGAGNGDGGDGGGGGGGDGSGGGSGDDSGGGGDGQASG